MSTDKQKTRSLALSCGAMVGADTYKMNKLQDTRAKAQAKLPHITVADHPYDIGYWAAAAGLEKPKRVASGSDLGEFEDGWQTFATERKAEATSPNTANQRTPEGGR